ncbi:hypothetical protein BC01_073 [Bacillus phage BC01]|nr:hypothetical protein BC01_073 [Bacillus phage BC01]
MWISSPRKIFYKQLKKCKQKWRRINGKATYPSRMYVYHPNDIPDRMWIPNRNFRVARSRIHFIRSWRIFHSWYLFRYHCKLIWTLRREFYA